MKVKIAQFIDGSGKKIKVTPEEKRKIEQVREIIKANSLLVDRKKTIYDAEFRTKEVPMGAGGVGQVRVMNSGEIRVQITCAWGNFQYAEAVII